MAETEQSARGCSGLKPRNPKAWNLRRIPGENHLKCAVHINVFGVGTKRKTHRKTSEEFSMQPSTGKTKASQLSCSSEAKVELWNNLLKLKHATTTSACQQQASETFHLLHSPQPRVMPKHGTTSERNLSADKVPLRWSSSSETNFEMQNYCCNGDDAKMTVSNLQPVRVPSIVVCSPAC